MEGFEKQSATTQQDGSSFASVDHSFRPVTENASDLKSAFQPLYQFPGRESVETAETSGNRPAGDTRALIEELKEKNYIKGFDAGKADACQVVQQELKEPVDLFLSEKRRLSDCFTKITDDYSGRIIELAVTIARKILGSAMQLDEERLEPLCHRLQTLLARHYQMTLKLNSQDLQSLNQMLACLQPEWQQSDALDITGDDAIHSGQMELKASRSSSDMLNGMLKEAFKKTITTA